MYGISTTIKSSMEEAEHKVIDALKSEGFGVLTQIDVQSVLKEKINVERTPYKILGACNPQLANHALNVDPDVGLLLPCNVVIKEDKPGTVVVSIIDPEAMFTVVKNDELNQTVAEVKEKVKRIINSISSN